MFVLSVWGRLKRRLRFSDDLLEFQGQTAVYRPPASRALVDVVALTQIARGERAAAERVVVNAVGQVVDIEEETQVFTRLPSGVKVDDFRISGDLAGRLNLSIDIHAFRHGVFARIADARTDRQAVVQPARSRIHHPNAGRHGANMGEAQIGKEIMREGSARFAPRKIDVAASEVVIAFDFPTAHLGGIGHIAEHAYRIAVAADRLVDGATLYAVVPTDIKLVLDDIVLHAVVEITDFQVESVVRFPDALFVDVEADVAVERRFALSDKD